VIFAEFLLGSFEDIERIGGIVTLGMIHDGIWQEYIRVESWNIVRAQFPGKEEKYRRIKDFHAQYDEYLENFYNRQQKTMFGF
jgi:hypothetical protein